jgi:hypothetical protein
MRESGFESPAFLSVQFFCSLHLDEDYRVVIIIIIIIIIVIIITKTSAFSSSLVLVTVFPQTGIEQGEHVCAIMFNARNL